MSYLEQADCLRPGGLELTRHGLTLCDFKKGAVIADVGSGKGLTVNLLKQLGFNAFGIDLNPLGEGIPQLSGDAGNLPLCFDALDGILCECVLCLMQEPQKVLKGFADVTRKGGFFLLTDLYLRNIPFDEQLAIADQSMMKSRLERAGWRLCHFEDHTHSLIALAAQLCWQGKSGAMPWAMCRYHNTQIPWKSCGYGLWVAQKER